MNAHHATGSSSISPDFWAAQRSLVQAWTRRLLQWGSDATMNGQARAAAPVVRELVKGGTTWFAEPLGRSVCCESGVLWLCFDGDPRDIVLEAGQTFTCDKGSPLSIHALNAGMVRVV